jgi:MOSC domain-containing protein YiiM
MAGEVAPARPHVAHQGIGSGLRWVETKPGTLAGIARHAFPKAPIEVVDAVAVTPEGGIAGDWRGAMKGRPYRRQVTILSRADWAAAMAEVGRNLPWWERRANLLVGDIDLPSVPGTRVRLGRDVVLEITRCCDPCERMDRLAPGLFDALSPGWRGGACASVVAGGMIHVGDTVEILA